MYPISEIAFGGDCCSTHRGRDPESLPQRYVDHTPPYCTENPSNSQLCSRAVKAEPVVGRGHRPWVKTARNARQLEVAGFVCQAPWRGLRPTAPGGFAPPKAAVSNCRLSRATLSPGSLIPHPSPRDTGARMRGGVFPLSPLPRLGEGRGQGEWGEGPNRPGGFASEGRSFDGRPWRGPTPAAAAIVRGWKPHKTPGTSTLRASLAKPPAGATPNRLGGFASRRPQFSTAGRPGAHRPSAAASVRGWKPHETPGN